MSDEEFAAKSEKAQEITRELMHELHLYDKQVDEIEVFRIVLKALVVDSN